MIESFLNPPFAQLVLRVVVGVLLMMHGYPKLFKNYANFSGWLDSLGLKPGKFWALVTFAVEFVGGIFLILGIFVQIVGALLVVQMLVAMWKVKWGKVGLLDPGGWEVDLLYLASGLVFLFGGAGMWALM